MNEVCTGGAHSFSADRPIAGRSDDRLSRRGFAEAIAKAIEEWHGHDSLVIAIYGPWGSGKSSIKNMIVQTLEEGAEASRPTLVDFNPWEFSSRENLTKSFFEEVASALGHSHIKRDEEREASLRRYAARLEVGHSITALLKDRAVLGLALIAAVLLGMTLVSASRALLIWFLITTLLAGALKRSALVAKALAGLFGERTRFDPSAYHRLKQQTVAALITRPAPLLVVMDDIDRLGTAEIREVFRLVKVHGDFPKLVYLLLFQRDVIETALGEDLAGSGRDFLEKIVQIGFDLPAIERRRIHGVLFNELNRILAPECITQRFSSSRFTGLFHGGLHYYFSSLRRVYRFATTFGFHVGLFREADSFGANPVDLIGIETLRVFEPEIYRVIAANKALFLGGQHPILEGETRVPKDREAIESVLGSIPSDRRDAVKGIVMQLFPHVKRVLEGTGAEALDQDAVYRELRVCSPKVFDRYFQLSLSEGELPQAQLDRLLLSTGDREALKRELRLLCEQGLLVQAIQGLAAYQGKLPLTDAEAFVTAVFDMSESLDADTVDPLSPSEALYAYWLLNGYLKRFRDSRRQTEILRNAVSRTEGIALPCAMIAWEGQTGDRPVGPLERLVPDEELKGLQSLCVENITRAAEAGDLLSVGNLRLVLECWSDWANAEARSYCERTARDPLKALRLVRAFLTGVRRTPLTEGEGMTLRYFRLGDIEKLVSWERLDETFKALTGPFSDDDREVLTAFQKAVHRRRQGKPDYDGRIILHDEFADDSGGMKS